MAEPEEAITSTQPLSKEQEPVCQIKKEVFISEKEWNKDHACYIEIKFDTKYDVCDDLDIKLEPVTEYLYIKNQDTVSATAPRVSTVFHNHGLDRNRLEVHIPNNHVKLKEATILVQCTSCGYNCICNGQRKKFCKCSICDYTCKAKSNAIKHIRIHTGKKTFKCEACNYTCTQKASFYQHRKTHTGEKPFQCHICDFKTAEKSTLKMHIFAHRGEKPFQCRLCDFKTAWKTSLKMHILGHTGEKPFKCDVCDYRCNWKAGLRKHSFIHMAEKPFKCGLCDYGCDSKSSLQRHILNHVGEKPIDYYYTVCEYKALHRSILKEHNYSYPYCTRPF